MSVNKKLVLRALTEPKFRKMLREAPQEVLNMGEIKGGQSEIDLLLAVLNGIDTQIIALSDRLLCTNSSNEGNLEPCGIN
jgi:hypothetical protein